MVPLILGNPQIDDNNSGPTVDKGNLAPLGILEILYHYFPATTAAAAAAPAPPKEKHGGFNM